jgi:Protein of unknown function (DUF1592)/Protein of unknown function (DUF1588)/Protein of unknown function (DUF1595)/Protein of unknown function (DUF1587)
MRRLNAMRRRGSPRWTLLLAGFASAQLLWACVGSIGDSDGENGGPDGPTTASQQIGATTRFARLTHEQYDNTVRDLLNQATDAPVYSDDFRADASSGQYLFDNDSYVIGLDQGLHRAYERAAAAIAEDFVNDAALFALWVPADGSDEDRARGFVEAFGERVHRRPLAADQVDDYLALFMLGSTTYGDTPGLQGAVRLMIEALMTSPYFLYRSELSHEPVEGIVPLDGYEIATRLSYTLWNTMPDEALFAAAQDGSLTEAEVLQAEVDRMLKDDRATAVFTKVLSQAMGVYRYENISPNQSVYPNAPADLPNLAIEELSLLMQDAYENGRSYRELLLEPRTFVNAELAPLYGLSGSFGAEFEETPLDAAERRGLLTTVGFLASNSSSVNPDPIHRGLFVAQKLLCSTVSAPPGEIPPLPTPDPDQTNREAIEAITEVPDSACVVCHGTVINPFGFPFENFDAVGSIRDNDNGNALNLKTSPTIDGETVEVDGALELIDALAQSEIVYQCYGQLLSSYLMGRPFQETDGDLSDRIGTAAFGDAPLVEVIAEALTSPQFTYRRLEDEG